VKLQYEFSRGGCKSSLCEASTGLCQMSAYAQDPMNFKGTVQVVAYVQVLLTLFTAQYYVSNCVLCIDTVLLLIENDGTIIFCVIKEQKDITIRVTSYIMNIGPNVFEIFFVSMDVQCTVLRSVQTS
jgi:hypothetical protein